MDAVEAVKGFGERHPVLTGVLKVVGVAAGADAIANSGKGSGGSSRSISSDDYFGSSSDDDYVDSLDVDDYDDSLSGRDYPDERSLPEEHTVPAHGQHYHTKERGDIWIVGRRRLICGDATSAEDVTALMDGKKANLIVTDPPYNVAFESSDGLSIKNDKMAEDKFYEFLLAAFKNMADNLEKGGAAYVFYADTEGKLGDEKQFLQGIVDSKVNKRIDIMFERQLSFVREVSKKLMER